MIRFYFACLFTFFLFSPLLLQATDCPANSLEKVGETGSGKVASERQAREDRIEASWHGNYTTTPLTLSSNQPSISFNYDQRSSFLPYHGSPRPRRVKATANAQGGVDISVGANQYNPASSFTVDKEGHVLFQGGKLEKEEVEKLLRIIHSRVH